MNPNPPLLGGSAQYSVVGLPANWIVSGYSWQYRSVGDCVSPWYPLSSTGGNEAAPVVAERYPGTFQVRCFLYYQIYPGPLQQTVLQTSVIIAPANGVRIAYGNGAAAAVGSSITVQFVPQSGGQDCGPYFMGEAQEMVTNKVVFGIPQPKQDDTSWNPALGVSDPAFYRNGPYIWDVKGQPAWSQLATWGLYKPFFTCTQQLRIAYTDLCGNPQTMPLGTIKWARALSAPGEWLLYTQ